MLCKSETGTHTVTEREREEREREREREGERERERALTATDPTSITVSFTHGTDLAEVPLTATDPYKYHSQFHTRYRPG